VRWIRLLVAFPICGIALLLPYRLRVLYAHLIASMVHLPFILFGRISRTLLRRLNVRELPEDCADA
jgi:hypothetical protein